MADGFDFLHLKRRTAGSSNELSFDVLDAASRELDEQAKRRRKRGARGTQGGRNTGMRGVAPIGGRSTRTVTQRASHARTSTYGGADEVKRRKHVRRVKSVRLQVIVALVLMVVLCGCVFVSHRFYQDHLDLTGHIDGLVGRLTQVDESIVVIDGIMRDPTNVTNAEACAQALDAMPQLQRDLNSISDDAQALTFREGAETATETLGDVVAAAETREGLLSAASDAFELAVQVNEEVSVLNDLWMTVLDADHQVRDAAQVANKATTVEETTAARDATAAAQSLFQSVLDRLATLQSPAGELDLEAQSNYLQKRIEALDYALATSDALIALDESAAQRANDAYNEAERDAADLAADLPTAPGDAVLTLYGDQIDEVRAAYKDAREAVSLADTRLRERLPY